jgi:hypothetical protein
MLNGIINYEGKIESMKRQGEKWHIIILLMVGLLLLAGCSAEASKEDIQLVNLNVERTGGLLSGIGKVKVYVDGEQVMKVKNNTTESVELHLASGTHTIQTKGQGDKSKEVEFEVMTGQDNTFTYQTEVSNVYGVSLQQIR